MATSFTDDVSLARWASDPDVGGHAETGRSTGADMRKRRSVIAARGRGIGFWRALPLALLISALLWGAVVKLAMALL